MIVFLLLLLVPSTLLYLYWYKKGRDHAFERLNQKSQKVELTQNLISKIVDPKSPNYVTPSAFSIALRMRYMVHRRNLLAETLELARRGYLKIEKETKKMLFGYKTNYVFTRLKLANNDKLFPYQRKILEYLFGENNRVDLNTLRKNDGLVLEEIKNEIRKNYIHKYFTRDPNADMTLGILLVIVFMLWGMLSFAFAIRFLSLHLGMAILMIFIYTIFYFVVSLSLSQRSSEGRYMYFVAKQLRKSLKDGSWKNKVDNKLSFIRNIMPYAAALGVMEKLANDIEHSNLKLPDYILSFAKTRSDLHLFAKKYGNALYPGLPFDTAIFTGTMAGATSD